MCAMCSLIWCVRPVCNPMNAYRSRVTANTRVSASRTLLPVLFFSDGNAAPTSVSSYTRHRPCRDRPWPVRTSSGRSEGKSAFLFGPIEVSSVESFRSSAEKKGDISQT
jgi:hypothetical protein